MIYSGCLSKMANVTVNVVPPASTPIGDSIFITGNHPLVGNWDPGLIALSKKSDSLWSITIDLPKGFYFEFKISRGSWNKQAVYKLAEIPSNIALTVSNDTTINIVPIDWQDLSFIAAGGIVGTVKYHNNFYSEGLKYSRDVIVWLPPSYTENDTNRYPVLYMHDGQNIIDPSTSFIGFDWHVDEIADSLIRYGKMKEIIIVGIYNTPDRREEYDDTELGRAYMKFIINKVKPFIDSNYRTLHDRKNTATMGSSMGGLISFLLAWNYPEIFSQCACLSPAFMGNITSLVENYTGADKEIRIYMDNGGVGLEERLQPGCEAMLKSLRKIGFIDGKNLLWFRDPDAEHNEHAWAERLWRPLLFMFGK